MPSHSDERYVREILERADEISGEYEGRLSKAESALSEAQARISQLEAALRNVLPFVGHHDYNQEQCDKACDEGRQALSPLQSDPALKALLSQSAQVQGEPDKPVAWRGRMTPSGKFYVVDTESESRELFDPEPLYRSPPQPGGADVAAEVMVAIRKLRQDVRPYIRHLEDCELVRFRQDYYSPSETKCPPCTCGLEKVRNYPFYVPTHLPMGRGLCAS